MKRVFVYIMALAASAAMFAAMAGPDGVSAFNSTTSGGPEPEANQVGQQPTLPLGEKLPPKHGNMDSILTQILGEYEQSERSSAAASAAANHAPMSRQASVAATFYTDAAQTQTLAQWLTDAGGDPRNIGEDYIEAYVPVSLLGEASEQLGVLSMRAIIPPQQAQRTQPSVGSGVHGSLSWNAAGFNGQGIKVGIIDGGRPGQGGFTNISALVGTELPAIAGVRCYTDIGRFSSNIEDCEVGTAVQGTGVAEAVADIAPEVSLYIANPYSRGDLRASDAWMTSQGVQVIVHSGSWIWDGPGDGTSPFSDSPLKAVDRTVSNGAVWVNSAGNEALGTWFGEFSDSDADNIHEFPSTQDSECNRVELDAGQALVAQLRWDDVWRGATKDIDLHLYQIADDGSLSTVVSSTSRQTGGTSDVPREVLSYTGGTEGTYCLSVVHVSGTIPAWIQLQSRGPNLESATLSGSISNPGESANPGMLAVGGAPWDNTSNIAEHSSRGPTPDERTKPEIVGAVGALSSAYGKNLRGTGQATSHVAGMAALVRQRFPDYSPSEVVNYLKTNAEARDSVPNNTWGHGFAKLPQLAAVVSTPTPAPTQSQSIAHIELISQAGFTYEGMERYEKVNDLCASALTDAYSSSFLDVNNTERVAIVTIQWICYDASDKVVPGATQTPAPISTPAPGETPTSTPTPAPGETPTSTPIATATVVPISTPETVCEYHDHEETNLPPDTPLIKGRTLSNIDYYYTPDHRLYDRRFIVERWFCTVAEAEAAGYIPAP